MPSAEEECLRYAQYDAPWIDKLTQEAAAFDRWKWFPSTIDVVDLGRGNMQLLGARGRIAEHTDKEFGPWSYLLILIAPENATLYVRKCQPLVLNPGMLLEFNAHVRHRLIQKKMEDTIWCPHDSKHRLDLDEALIKMKEEFAS